MASPGVSALFRWLSLATALILGQPRRPNITRALPAIVRSFPMFKPTVAHGTAYDPVGTDRADYTMMLTAIKTAASLVAGKGFLE